MKLPVFVLLLLPVLFAGFGAYLWGSRRIAASSRNPEKVLRQKIDRARLIGASPKRVKEFLDRHGIDHGDYVRRPSIPEDDRLISALIPNAGSAHEMPIPFKYDLLIKFQFNERDRLKDVSIEEVFSSAP